jgi:hypothetical protein
VKGSLIVPVSCDQLRPASARSGRLRTFTNCMGFGQFGHRSGRRLMGYRSQRGAAKLFRIAHVGDANGSHPIPTGSMNWSSGQWRDVPTYHVDDLGEPAFVDVRSVLIGRILGQSHRPAAVRAGRHCIGFDHGGCVHCHDCWSSSGTGSTRSNRQSGHPKHSNSGRPIAASSATSFIGCAHSGHAGTFIGLPPFPPNCD